MLNLFPYTRSGNREEKKKKEKLAGEQNNTTGGNPSFDCTECLYIYYIVVYSRTGCWKGRHSSCLRKMCCLFLSLMEDAMDLNCLERERVCVSVCVSGRLLLRSFFCHPPLFFIAYSERRFHRQRQTKKKKKKKKKKWENFVWGGRWAHARKTVFALR